MDDIVSPCQLLQLHLRVDVDKIDLCYKVSAIWFGKITGGFFNERQEYTSTHQS